MIVLAECKIPLLVRYKIMTKSLDEKFLYSLDVIVYDYFPGDILDYREVKTLDTLLWIIKWSDGINEIDCFEIVKRALANYGYVFDFDEREVVWAIIRLLEKGLLSSIFMGPAEDLPLHSSIVPAIKIVKVNNKELVADALADNIENTIIVTADDHACLKIQNMQVCNMLRREEEEGIIINNSSGSMMQDDELSSMERYKN
jgi:hypothetical protein